MSFHLRECVSISTSMWHVLPICLCMFVFLLQFRSFRTLYNEIVINMYILNWRPWPINNHLCLQNLECSAGCFSTSTLNTIQFMKTYTAPSQILNVYDGITYDIYIGNTYTSSWFLMIEIANSLPKQCSISIQYL